MNRLLLAAFLSVVPALVVFAGFECANGFLLRVTPMADTTASDILVAGLAPKHHCSPLETLSCYGPQNPYNSCPSARDPNECVDGPFSQCYRCSLDGNFRICVRDDYLTCIDHAGGTSPCGFLSRSECVWDYNNQKCVCLANIMGWPPYGTDACPQSNCKNLE